MNRFYYEWSRQYRKFVVWDRKISQRLAYVEDRDVAEKICLLFYKDYLSSLGQTASAKSV